MDVDASPLVADAIEEAASIPKRPKLKRPKFARLKLAILKQMELSLDWRSK
jgi:hypothetical protein